MCGNIEKHKPIEVCAVLGKNNYVQSYFERSLSVHVLIRISRAFHLTGRTRKAFFIVFNLHDGSERTLVKAIEGKRIFFSYVNSGYFYYIFVYDIFGVSLWVLHPCPESRV